MCGIDKADNEDSFLLSTQPKICLDSAPPGRWLQVFFFCLFVRFLVCSKAVCLKRCCSHKRLIVA